MSLLGTKPKIEKVVAGLSDADARLLEGLLDTPPMNIPSYDYGTLPTASGNVFLARVYGQSGYVLYSLGKKYLVGYVNYDCTLYEITSAGLSDLNEYLSILELRYVVGNRLDPTGKTDVIDFTATKSGTAITCTSSGWSASDLSEGCIYVLDIAYAYEGALTASDSVSIALADGTTANIQKGSHICTIGDLRQVHMPYASGNHRFLFEAIWSGGVFGLIPATSAQDVVSITAEELLDLQTGTTEYVYNDGQLFYCTDTSANGYAQGHTYKATYDFSTGDVSFTDMYRSDYVETFSSVADFQAKYPASTTEALGNIKMNFDDGAYLLKDYKKIHNINNSVDFSSVLNLNNSFENNTNLISFTSDLPNASTLQYAFNSCENLNLFISNCSKTLIFSYAFRYCVSLSIFISDISKGTDFQNAFIGCAFRSFTLDAPKGINFIGTWSEEANLISFSSDLSEGEDIKYTWQNCSSLISIIINVPKATNFNGAFNNCSSLKSVILTGLKVSFDISSSTAFEETDLVALFNSLGSPTTTQTITMGSTNLAKLTDADKLIATNKGWTLA